MTGPTGDGVADRATLYFASTANRAPGQLPVAIIVAVMPEQDTRNPAAVALSKLGPSKGGKARAQKLSAAKRKEIAKNAAKKRWGNR